MDSNTTYLRPDLPIKLVEKASIKFTEDFSGDVSGSNITIDVTADDDLLCKIGQERTLEITKDIANDDIIIIDVDDPSRFLKKPTGEMTKQLWPMYDDVNYLGVKDSKDYPTIPNSGYVNSANVNFQAYDIGSLPLLFDPSVQIKPTGGHTIHVTSSENSDWNVYELKPINADINFVARQDDKVSLFTNYSLFNYVDGNMIGEDDTGRYLDYYLTLRNADVSDNVVVWTNETIIQQAQSTISNLSAPRMIEARIASIGPSEDSIRTFTDYIPAGDNFYTNVEMSASGLEQGDRPNIVNTVSAVENLGGTVESNTNPNSESVSVIFDGTGSDLELSVTWDTDVLTSGVYVSTANIVTIVNGGNNYQVGDLVSFVPGNASVGESTVRVTEVQGVEYDSIPSNVITIGRIQNNTIQDGDVIRLVNGGKTSTASVLVSNISLDYDNRTITFANVSNAEEFIVQNTLYLTTSPNASSKVNKYAYTILDNSGNAVAVTSTSLTSSEAMASLEIGDFGSVNEIRSTDVFDLGDPSVPNDTDSYYTVFNVGTNGTGTTTLQIERPDTFFNLEDVTSDVTNIRVKTATTVTANVTGNVFTTGENSIRISGYNGALSAMNGVWTVLNVVQNNFNSNEDLVTFNTIKTLPLGDFAPPSSVYKTDTSLTVNLIHQNKTRLIMPNVGDINVGDQIKVLGNVFNGTYNADSVIFDHNTGLNDDSFVTYVDIPAPFIFDTQRSGNVLMGGMKITTTNPHGISPEYAAQNKRVGVHFAFPKAYNRFYNVTRVDPYNIYIDDVKTQSDETVDFYRYETTSVSRNDNIYVTTNDPLLNRTTVTYASNASVIAPSKYSVNDGIITFSPDVLPVSNAYVTVNVVREINRSFDRFPVVTTVDHNKIRLNGVNFTINSYNNPEAIAENINRAASLMRGWLTPTGSGMQFSFPMLKDYRTPVFAPDGSLRPAHTINNYGPYIRDKNTLARIANDPDIDTGVLTISNLNELNRNETFNAGAIKVGPTRGATYFDTERKTWMIWLQEGPTDTEGGYYPLGVYYDDQNRKVLPKRKKTFKVVPSGHNDSGPILDVIPGSYPTQRSNPNIAGQTQYEYDLRAVKEYGFPPLWIDSDGTEVVPLELRSIQDANRQRGTVNLYRYRLKPSTQGYFEVYEMVELTNGEIIGIKVDSAQPPLTEHNYYGTQTNAGNFFGLASNSINFDNKTTFNAGSVDLYPNYTNGSVILGPVSPPSDVGKTLIPEPFAFRRSGRTTGNGSDSVLNFEALPFTEVFGPNGVTFDVSKPGFDTFNIWQPGMIPGLKNPPNTNSQTINLPFGRGRGYYELNDGTTPEMFQVISTQEDMVDATDYGNITMGWAEPRHCPSNNPFLDCTIGSETPVTNDYPAIDSDLGWYNPQPRFRYSKRFTIETNTTNDDQYNIENDLANSSTYYNTQETRYAYKTKQGNGAQPAEVTNPIFINGEYPNPASTRFRPDEIFVACFWTEPYLYKNQIVSYGPDPQNAGTRRPIIKDYYGTITRCKYIRLTELPLDAVLVRPECDTGWGGESLEDSSQNNRTRDQGATALDLLSAPKDERAGTSATQNQNINTGADFTGGVTQEDPNPNEASALDINNQQQLPAGYQSRDNIIVEPGEQNSATLPNIESRQASGIGLDDLSNITFAQQLANGSEPFDNQGTTVNESLQQNTTIDYPTLKNSNESASPVLNPPTIILPGKCDIEPAPTGGSAVTGGACDTANSSVLAFTASNNYYGIQLTGTDWQTQSQNTEVPKYEWHNFGKVANKYRNGTEAWIELVVDFRDDTLTAGGITVVQSAFPFGTLPGQSFDPRNSGNQGAVNRWWETARVIDNLTTLETNSTNILHYGVQNFGGPAGRATGNFINSVNRIGLTQGDGQSAPITRPGDFGFQTSVDWLTDNSIIGGTNNQSFSELNSTKGAIALQGELNCNFGQYLTVFVHIGHGSGNNGAVIPRYDLYIRYNHNIDGYGGTRPSGNDPCNDGSVPKSAIYAGGAHAKAYKSKTTSSTDNRYKTSTIMKAGTTNTIRWGPTSSPQGKDETDLLPQGDVSAWLFDNIYFPYDGPVRQGTSRPNTGDGGGAGGGAGGGGGGSGGGSGGGGGGGGGFGGPTDGLDFNSR